MLELLDGIRRIVTNWTVTTSHLTSDASEGDTAIAVVSTRRFFAGDELLIKSDHESGEDRMENRLRVESVTDNTHLVLADPLLFDWTVANNAAIVKTFNDMHIKKIFIGEPDIIELDQLPAITVNGTNRSSEFLTIRGTKERYNVEIGIYVPEGTQEDGYRFLLELTKRIEKGLKKNLYPLLNDYSQTVLTEPTASGDRFVKVADSTIFNGYSTMLLEDEFDVQEFQVEVTDTAGVINLHNCANRVFATATTKVIVPHRFIYNSWPADIDYGKIHKGTLLKAAVIKFFAEEYEPQFEASWIDTQLR